MDDFYEYFEKVIETSFTTFATKNEVGALRALFPGNTMHYFISGYIL